MASIFKRGDTWWIRYYVGGRSVSRSLKTPHERVALENKQKIEGLVLADLLPTPSSCPLKEVIQSFCEFMIGSRTKKSAKNEIGYLRSYFGPCCPALEMKPRSPHKFRGPGKELPKVKEDRKGRYIPVSRLEQITTEMVSSFLRERMIRDHVVPKTLNRQRGVLHRLFTYAAEHHGYICPDRRYRNPVTGVKRMRETAPEISWLTQEQITKQLEALQENAKIHTMVAVYIYAGLRREEALWLTHEDVDFKRRLIRVCAKTVEGEYWQPKTRQNRVVPISQALLAILLKYKPTAESPWFFPSPQGTHWDPDNFSADLRELNMKHGLTWACLDFRHTFGSQLAQKGESLFKIATLMGNSPEICRRHYAALVPEAMHDTVEFEPPKEESTAFKLHSKQTIHATGQPRLRLVY
jgi:integrase